MSLSIIAVLVAATALCGVAAAEQLEKTCLRVRETVFVDKAWTGASMPIALETRGDRQYVAYYDAEGWMKIASRSLDSTEWTRQRLDNKTAWDTHNWVTFAFDSEGHLHVSGNMHNVPLRYYRTTKPGDVTSLEKVNRMTGEAENRVSYPRFLRGPKGEFLFIYRDGGSGNGNNIVNVYDVETRTWKRYMDKALFDGEGLTSVYYRGPLRDSKGNYHLAWEWRDTPDVSTNHDMSYARSIGSLSNWQKSDGTPIELPLRIGNCEIIDPAPVNSGLMMPALSLDSQDRPLVSYVKFDPKGRSQIYTMRREGSGWKRYQTTNWAERWDALWGGILDQPFSFISPQPWKEGVLCQVFFNRFLAPYKQIRFLEETKLRQIGDPVRLYPPGWDTPTTSTEGDWHVMTTELDLESLRTTGRTWILRWDAMRPNRDRPREKVPPPSRLEVVGLEVNQ